MSPAHIISFLTTFQLSYGHAAALDIAAPTFKRQIDVLERAGFVERRPVPDDGRKNALFQTDRGRDSAVVDLTARTRAELVAVIPPEDLAMAQSVLDRISAGLLGAAAVPLSTLAFMYML